MKRILAMALCIVMLLFSASCKKMDKTLGLEPTLFVPTQAPGESQTAEDTAVPTIVPTVTPTENPSAAPTVAPTKTPTTAPTVAPTVKPTTAPTTRPTTAPTAAPTQKPTVAPSVPVTISPTTTPVQRPTVTPTTNPTTAPTTAPTTVPTEPGAYYTYSDSYGNSIQLPEGVDVFDYTLSQAKLPVAVSNYPAIEQKIFQLTNAERAKQGLAPVALEEKAYYFAATRAYEASVQWSHTRPNGELYHHIFAEYKVICSSGENLHYTQGGSLSANYASSQDGADDLAEKAITGWMNSPGHRENILNELWSSMAVGVYYDAQENKLVSVQLFFA